MTRNTSLILKSKHIQAYMQTAYVFSRCSPAKRLQVGSVIVKNNNIIACGYNALPMHLDGSCELLNGQTDPLVRHAEKNALMSLTKSNQSSQGSVMFCTHACCINCAVDIVDAGIEEFYYSEEYRDQAGLQYLRKNCVTVIKLNN